MQKIVRLSLIDKKITGKGQFSSRKVDFEKSNQGPRVLPVYENDMPRFLANSFLGLNYVCSVQAWYIS